MCRKALKNVRGARPHANHIFPEKKLFEIRVQNWGYEPCIFNVFRDAHVKRLTSLNFSLFFVVSDYISISLSRMIMIHCAFDCSNLGEHTTNLQRIDRVCRKVFRLLQRPSSGLKVKSRDSID